MPFIRNWLLARSLYKNSERNWWLVKHGAHRKGYVDLNLVSFPEEMIGKKVRFRVEVIEDDKRSISPGDERDQSSAEHQAEEAGKSHD